MTPSLGAYVGGCFALAGIAAALGLGGYWLRRWIVPEFSGALARHAEVTIAVAQLVLSLELVGTIGIFRLGWIVLACILVGLGAAALGRRKAPRDADPVEPPRVHPWMLLIAVGVASWTVAEWSFPSQLSLDEGMFGGDTTWYHMPFAARFVQDASIWDLHLTDPLRLVAWFYPQSSELINGAGIAIFQSDWISPLINMGWLAMGLLACWCIGRPYNVGPATLVAGAIVFDAGIFIETQAGEGRNDVMALALLVAFAAFLINGHQRYAPASGPVADKPDPHAPLLDKGPLIMAGLAGGLAISVKLTMLAPVGAIALGVVAFSGRGRRLTSALVMGAAMFVNPIPQLKFGPLNLPTPDQMPLDPRPRFSVAHYLGEPTIYRKWFFPELDNALGPLYPLILVVAFVATVYIVVRSRNRILRVLAAGALLTAVVYLFTPLTAAGPEGEPRGFFTNTRYLMPGLVLGLVMLPIARPLRAPERRAWAGFIAGTVFFVAVLIWVPAGLAYLRGEGRVGRAGIAAGVGAVLLVAIVLGRAQQVQYVDNHYTRATVFLQEGGPVKAFEWVRDLRDKRIGIAGSGEIFFSQYGMYGVDLSNRVDFLGIEGPNGQHRLATSCRAFRNRINRGDYDYIVISQYTQDSPDADYRYPLRAWTKTDPALREILAEEDVTPQPDYVYEVTGRLDPAGCANLGETTPS